MNQSSVVVGMYVYHRIYLHLGRGTVVGIKPCGMLEAMFERGSMLRVVVRFENEKEEWTVQAAALVKRPDKVRVEWARSRGYQVTIDKQPRTTRRKARRP